MAVTVTKLQIFRVVDQIITALVGMQRDMVNNANAWAAQAVAQSPDIVTLSKHMADAAASYERILGWILAYKNTSQNWTAVVTMYVAIGGSANDVVNHYTTLKTVADALSAANITTYAQVTNACNQILAAVSKPDSIWPE